MKAIILDTDDGYQAFYVQGKLVDSGRSLGEGFGLIHFLQEHQKTYGYRLEDIEQESLCWEDQELVEMMGYFPQSMDEFEEEY